MFYKNLKKFIKKFPPLWKFLTWSMDCLIILSRLKDVLMMMILLHVWPEQTYRFSTRKLLPRKENRFSKESKPFIPYVFLADKGSNIAKMKEINVIGRGSSFNLNNLKNNVRKGIYLGIRSVNLHPEKGKLENYTILNGEVIAIELLGNQKHIYIEYQDIEIVATFRSEVEVILNSNFELFLDLTKAYFFDIESGERVY